MATNNTFSFLLCMFALSSMTGMNITTVYPEIIGKETKYSKFLNTYEIFEYNIPLEQHILQFLVNLFKISNLSCCGQLLVLLFSLVWISSFKLNHFVPLVQIQQSKGNIKSKVKVQPKITVLKSARRDTTVSKGKHFRTLHGIHTLCVSFIHVL